MYIFTLVLICFYACTNTAKTNPHTPFHGLWKLHVFEYQDSTGVWKEYWWNKGGDSYIMYDGLGHMAVHITPEGYQDFDVKSPKKPVDSLNMDELRYDLKAYSSSYVYMANCNILEDEQVIEHQRISHTYPFDWGVTVQRKFRFEGDTLFLSPVEGKFPRRLKWVKQH
jgi:hypothetical protein